MTTTLEQPRVRSDLRVSEQNGQEETTFVVKDPATGRFFRFGAAEHFIAQQLDGATSFDAVRQRFEQKFGTPLSPESVGEFVGTLHRLGLLETERPEDGRRTQRGGWFRGNPLYLRLKAFDPDRLLDRLEPKVGLFFTRSFLIASSVLICLAFIVSVSNSVEIGRDLLRLYRVQTLLAAWLTIFAVTTAHEFAHGLTCKRFGGEVHEMGFLLIYFQLAFYCNVSDAWLFPEKAKRLWVTFAGPYFELFLWALAVLAWRVSQPETWLNFLALVVVATSALKLVVNLNPLIKLDGYYLLSDCLGVPNLRQKSFAYLRARLKALSGAVAEGDGEATPRERHIYLAYGLLAGAYSFFLLGFVAVHFGGYLIGRYQGLGFILFAGLLFIALRPRLKRALARHGARVEPTGQPGRARALLGWANRRKRSLIALALATAVAFLVRLPLTVSGEFTVSPIRNADIRAQVEGFVEEIYVDEGDLVRAGDPIARLSNRDTRAELRRFEAAIDEAGARLRMLEARLKYASNDLGRWKALFAADLVSRKQLEEVEERAAVGGKEIEATRAGLAGLEVQRRHVEEQLGLLRVLSSVTGVITTPKPKERTGDHLQKGDLIVRVHELENVKTEVAVFEKEIGDVQVGQPVELRARAYPERTFTGRVTAIAPAAVDEAAGPGVKIVRVTSEIENPERRLRSDMTGTAKILCGERRIVDLMTRRLARYVRVEVWSWWW
jgi:RND family efflux transporter MFP subunit